MLGGPPEDMVARCAAVVVVRCILHFPSIGPLHKQRQRKRREPSLLRGAPDRLDESWPSACAAPIASTRVRM